VSQLPFLLPWLRVALLIRSILSTPFDETTWPTAKTVVARALTMRRSRFSPRRSGVVARSGTR
jgi:hypothetical protein